MKFEKVLIHFLSNVLVCCHPENLLPWQRDATTSLLYYNSNYKLQVTRHTMSIQQTINYVFVFCNWNGLREGSLYRPTLYVSQFKSKAVFDSDFQSVLDYGFLVRGTNGFRIPIVSRNADSLSWMPRNSDSLSKDFPIADSACKNVKDSEIRITWRLFMK